MGDRFRVYISAQGFGEGAHFRFGTTYALYRRRPYGGLLLAHRGGIEPLTNSNQATGGAPPHFNCTP